MNNEMTTYNMSNEEVIEVLKGIVFGGFERTTPKEREAIHLAIKLLEEKPQGKWVLVGERLPEENVCDDGYHEPSKWVLVQARNGYMYTTRYWTRDKKNVWTDLDYPEDIIAWQPLPEPYKEEGAE